MKKLMLLAALAVSLMLSSTASAYCYRAAYGDCDGNSCAYGDRYRHDRDRGQNDRCYGGWRGEYCCEENGR